MALCMDLTRVTENGSRMGVKIISRMAALDIEKLDTVSPGMVTVMFEGVQVRRSAHAHEYTYTTDVNPLLSSGNTAGLIYIVLHYTCRSIS